MARKRRPTGDDATVARKRFYRKAERYLKESRTQTGATAARSRYLAEIHLKEALKTYSAKTTQTFSKPIRNLAADLGVNLETFREKLKKQNSETSEKIRQGVIQIEGEAKKDKTSKSAKALERNIKDIDTRRESEARMILNSPIGKRIMGGAVEVWREEASIETDEGIKIDKTKLLPLLFDYFKVDNLTDLLTQVEKIVGDVLYAADDQDAMYEAAKVTLQKHIAADNSLAA